MSRILAVDYGSKRVGLAETDPMQLIASPLTTVEREKAVDFIGKFCRDQAVKVIVVGFPRHLDGRDAEIESEIKAFIREVEIAAPGIRIARIDERFTSKIASQSIAVSGLGKNKRQDKGLIDRTSAALILQSYLEQNK